MLLPLPVSYPRRPWSRFVSNARRSVCSASALDFLDRLLRVDHHQRLTTREALEHPYIADLEPKPEPPLAQPAPAAAVVAASPLQAGRRGELGRKRKSGADLDASVPREYTDDAEMEDELGMDESDETDGDSDEKRTDMLPLGSREATTAPPSPPPLHHLALS